MTTGTSMFHRDHAREGRSAGTCKGGILNAQDDCEGRHVAADRNCRDLCDLFLDLSLSET
jgi:hypothetical protein